MSGYQHNFTDAMAQYTMLDTFNIDYAIDRLDGALYSYSQKQTPDSVYKFRI